VRALLDDRDLERETFRLFRMHADGSGWELIVRLPFAPRHIDWGSGPSAPGRQSG
jgi:hypothetical protein